MIELADSIREVGQITAAKAKKLEKPDGNGCEYELIDGERRWRALKMANVDFVKLEVIEVNGEDEQYLISVISNYGSAGHNAIEELELVTRLTKSGKTPLEIAKAATRSVAWVTQRLKLAKLSPKVQAMMMPPVPEKDWLAITTAELVAGIPDHDEQFDVASEIVRRKLTLTRATSLIRKKGKQCGVMVDSGDHTPRKDRRSLENMLDSMAAKLDFWVAEEDRFYEAMFCRLGITSIDEMASQITRCKDELGDILAALHRVRKKIERNRS